MIWRYSQDGAVFLGEVPEGTSEAELKCSAEEVARAFHGHAFLAEIVGLHRAMRDYLGEEKWAQAVSRVSWTGDDFRILRDIGANPPSMSLSPDERTGDILSAYVDAAYQSKTFSNTCHVRTHAWCSEDPAVGKPCGSRVPDCAEIGCDLAHPEDCASETCAFRIVREVTGATNMPFYNAPIVVRASAENHSRLPSDQF